MRLKNLLLIAAGFSLTAVIPSASPNEQGDLYIRTEMVLDDMVVYGIRPDSTSQPHLNNYGQSWIGIKQALEQTGNVRLSFDVEFAPRSVVMTADGRDTVNLLASAMKHIEDDVVFEVWVDKLPGDGTRDRSRLALERAQAVVYHLQINNQVGNSLIITDQGYLSGSALPPGLDRAENTQRIVMVNKGRSG